MALEDNADGILVVHMLYFITYFCLLSLNTVSGVK